MPKPLSLETDPANGLKFARIAAGLSALICLFPYFYGSMLEPVGQSYLGYQYNIDDHMVYSAWMRQAMDGRFFFDNRFAVEAQPGLTVHLYFFVLGLIAKFLGLALTANLAKAGFAALFVLLLHRLLVRLNPNVFFVKLALSFTVVGGGIGFLVWHRFGEAMVAGDGGPFAGILQSRLPTDVWQPEAFVFPSMLTNGLFMVSLCLILGIFLCVLQARDSWRPVFPGFLCFALLMNIHSYDVLLVGLVLFAFLAAGLASRTVTALWLGRTVVMVLGVAGPALWFWHVLQTDPVFQARAATDTFSPNFRQVAMGLVVLVAVGLVGLRKGPEPDERSSRRLIGAWLLGIGFLILFALAGNVYERFWLEPVGWAAVFAFAVGAAVLLAGSNIAWNLVVAWAAAGVAAIYFPALFQRKLSMGMSIPWAIVAAIGVWQISLKMERGTRNLVSVLAILVLGATSIRWFLREGEYIKADVSRTTLHPIFLTNDVVRILEYLDHIPSRKVVLAMPGIANPETSEDGTVVDRFRSPYIPDLNAIVSGLTGAYSFAGHWSETPKYLERRNRSTAFFLKSMPDADKSALIREIGATHILAPVPESFPEFFDLTKAQLDDLTRYGNVVVDGTQFRLIEIVG